MSIGERISGLSPLPDSPEENWRRTEPSLFFIPPEDVVNNFGQTVLGSHLAAAPYKIQFKTVALEQMCESLSRILGVSAGEILAADDEQADKNLAAQLVLLELNNGALTVSSCAEADESVRQLELASRPARPETLMRGSPIATALTERLQLCAPSQFLLKIPLLRIAPIVVIAIENEPAFNQSYANLTIELADEAVADVAVVHGNCGFAHHRVSLRVGRDARLNQFWAQSAGKSDYKSTMLIERSVKLAAHAQFHDASVFVPSGILRVMSHVVPEAEGAMAQCGAAILASGHSVVDYEPLQEHSAPKAQTHLRAKMIAGQRGRAIFQGLIDVDWDASGTVASQVNKNLLLSKRARIDAMPRLRILPDEVACKHGSATGELDSKQMYYLQSRGFTEQQAKEQIVSGFIFDGLSCLPQESILQSWAALLLRQGLARILA
jgi:hypothetical protein